MRKRISVLGSTGSIGIQTLDAARSLGIEVLALTADTNIDLLEKQALEFMPRIIAVNDIDKAAELEVRLKNSKINILSGIEGICKAAVIENADIVVASIVGIAGLIPVLEAIKAGRDIALANKETLVAAGPLVMAEAEKAGVKILPVDSEHSAIFQCIQGNNKKDINKIILTASGGPFRGKSIDELKHATPGQALKHPNWSMGSKITIDSATLMNKALEVIEARWLFGIEPEQIEVLIHPQSIIHSMVEYVDGSIMAQLGPPDMRIPIQYALAYPERKESNFTKLDFRTINALNFEMPDYTAFPCLKLAWEALAAGGTMPAVMNAANEEAVGLFLKNKIGFTDIPIIIECIMNLHIVNTDLALDKILEADKWAREKVKGGLV